MRINYDDPIKDAEIWQLIESGKEFLLKSGWNMDKIENNSSINAIVLYIKLFQSDNFNFESNPLLVNLILQNRS